MFDHRDTVYEHVLHAFRKLIRDLKRRQSRTLAGSNMTMSAHIPRFNTPRSVKRIRCAGSALNLRIASSSVNSLSSRTYLRRMRGKVP